ncbi:unnamed protein product, partial [Prorocentrum cordatum]
DSQVHKTASTTLELKTPVVVLTAKDLMREMEWQRLPKHIKSITTVKMPKQSMMIPSSSAGSASRADYDELFCFRDPSRPFREGNLVQTIGVSIEQSALAEQFWGGQACKMAEKTSRELDVQLGLNGVADTYHTMQTLDEFKKTREVKKLPRSNLGAEGETAGGGTVIVEDCVNSEDEDVQLEAAVHASALAQSPDGASQIDDNTFAELVSDARANLKRSSSLCTMPYYDGDLDAGGSAVKTSRRFGASAGDPSPGKTPSWCGQSAAGTAFGDEDEVQDFKLEGEALYQRKLSRLPLTRMMAEDIKGGWGRAVGGAEKAMKRLASKDEHKVIGAKLQDHIDLANECLQLPPASLPTLPREKVLRIAANLKAKGVAIAISTQISLTVKEAGHIIQMYIGPTRLHVTDQQVGSLLRTLLPFTLEVKEVFDPEHPRLAAIEVADESKFDTWTKVVLTSFIVPRIYDGKEYSKHVQFFFQALGKHFKQVDKLDLNGPEAQMVSEVEDINTVFDCLSGGLDQAAANSSIVKEFIDASKTEGSGWWLSVASACMRTNFYKEQLEKIQRDMPFMEPVMEEICKINEKLNNTSSSVIGQGLKDAAKLLTDYADHAGDWLKPFAESINGKAQAWFDMIVNVEMLFDYSVDSVQDAKMTEAKEVTTQAVQEIVHELSLAFPMSEWTHDMTARLGSLLKSAAEARFTKKFEAVLVGINGALDSSNAPPEDSHHKLASVLVEARVTEHFFQTETQGILKDCIVKVSSMRVELLDLKVHHFFDSIVETLPFYYGTDLVHEKTIIQAIQSALTCMHETKLASDYYNNADGWDPTWEKRAETLSRAGLHLRKILAKLKFYQEPQGSQPSESNALVCQDLADHLLLAMDRSTSMLNTLVEKGSEYTVEDNITSVIDMNRYSLGDAAGGDAHWLISEKPLAEWTEWEELHAKFVTSFAKLPAGKMKAAIEECKEKLKNTQKLETMFSIDLKSKNMADDIKAASTTKLTCAMINEVMKIKKDRDKDVDKRRDAVRQAILQLREVHGLKKGDDYTPYLPKVLVVEAESVVAKKRVK